MLQKKKILILCTSDYLRQPRVYRTIDALKDSYQVIVSGYSDAAAHTVEFIPYEQAARKYWHFNKPLFIRLPVSLFIKAKLFFQTVSGQAKPDAASEITAAKLKKVSADAIICHGYENLSLAFSVAGNTIPVIFNAHEYYPLEFEQSAEWLRMEKPKVDAILRNYLPKCKKMFCVTSLIAKEYHKHYKIESVIITNATAYENLQPAPVSSPVKIVHHGAAMRAREVELMAEMMNHLGKDYELHFMLFPTEPEYLAELKSKYSGNKQIVFQKIVSPQHIAATINQYDIGLFILPPVNFNWKHALPNKLFEYIQARLCLAVSPNPDMAELVSSNDLGVVSADYSARAMAEAIKALDAGKIAYHKSRSVHAAAQYNAGVTMRLIRKNIDDLFN